MRHKIRVPDGTVVEVEAPDGATPDEIVAFAEENYRAQAKPAATVGARKFQPSTGQDMLGAAAYALPKLAASIAGFPVDALSMLNRGGEWLASKSHGGKPEDYRGIGLDLPGGSQTFRGAAEVVTGPWYDPQTRAGKVVDTGVQTAATMGKNWLTAPREAAKVVAGVTAGTEGAGAATGDDWRARMLGGIFGGVVPVVANAARSRPGQEVRDAIGTPKEDEIARAIAMQERARAAGVPLLGTESLDAGHQLASAIYASPTGNSVLEPFLRQRPGQVQGAVEGGLLAQTGPRATPAANATAAQKAATQVIDRAEGARSAAVAKDYAKAEYAEVPPQAMRPVANEIQNQIFKTPVNSPAEKAIGAWYKQAFPRDVEPVAVENAGKGARGPKMPVQVDVQQDDVITAIRKLGGLNPGDEAIGSLAKGNPFAPDPRFGPVWRAPAYGTSVSNKTQAGHSLDHMAQLLYERGYIGARDPDMVMEAIAGTSLGKPQYSTFRDPPNVDPLATSIDRLVSQLSAKAERKNPVPAMQPEAVLPETNVGRLTRLYQNLGIERDVPSIGATSEQKFASYPAGKVQDALGDMLRTNNADFRRGNEKYARITEKIVDPLKAGPLGTIAGKRGYDPAEASPVPRVLGTVTDANVARPETIKHIYTRLNRTDRQAFPGLVQTHLENKLNTALADIRSGGNPTAGAKFRQEIVGTPQEQANFDEMMRGVAQARGANPELLVQGANKLLDVLERTGRTPGIGSQTQPRAEIAKTLERTKFGDVMEAVSAKPLGAAARRWNEWVSRYRYEGLAQALTAPESVQLLVKMAKVQPNSLTASYYAAVLLGMNDEAKAAQ